MALLNILYKLHQYGLHRCPYCLPLGEQDAVALAREDVLSNVPRLALLAGHLIGIIEGGAGFVRGSWRIDIASSPVATG